MKRVKEDLLNVDWLQRRLAADVDEFCFSREAANLINAVSAKHGNRDAVTRTEMIETRNEDREFVWQAWHRIDLSAMR